MKIDRGIIKWQPFNSVAPASATINKLAKERQKVSKPILSEEQLNSIQDNLLLAYNNEIKTNIEYYKNGRIIRVFNIIKLIDLDNKRIILDNNYAIYFNQIIKIIN